MASSVKISFIVTTTYSTCMVFLSIMEPIWRTPNSLKDSNVSPSERQRKKEESGRTP
jgi:hypothetical protein